MSEWLFWIALFIIVYAYCGYALVLMVLVGVKRMLFGKRKEDQNQDEWPEVTLFVTAYNEAGFVNSKVENSFNLSYPKDKLKFLWITDGSTDGTPELLQKYPQIRVEHWTERRGKVHAMNRGVQFVETPYVIFSDTNTMLSADSLQNLIRHFRNPEVACVGGEKRVLTDGGTNVAADGENMYWNFESKIKQMESELSSVVGVAGELFALRTDLYHPVPDDCLLDDFQISMGLAADGYRIVYEPNAIAMERASLNVKEELKRKSRIAAGGLQSMVRMPQLLNPIKLGCLSFQYFSHKILRWTLAPWALIVALTANIALVAANSSDLIYILSLGFQFLWYLLALLGFMFEGYIRSNKLLFIPYYFTAIHLAAFTGLYRFVGKKQTVAWDKAQRA